MTQIKFSDESLKLVQELIARYPEGRQKSALIPVLHIAQAEFDGWLSAPVMDYVASLLKLQPIEVYEVASFYSMFNLKPVGKCVIEVCRTSSCWLLGAEDVIRHLEKKLNIKVGQPTCIIGAVPQEPRHSTDLRVNMPSAVVCPTLMFSPMMQVGADYYENLNLQKVDQLVDRFRADNKRKSYTDTPEPRNV